MKKHLYRVDYTEYIDGRKQLSIFQSNVVASSFGEAEVKFNEVFKDVDHRINNIAKEKIDAL